MTSSVPTVAARPQYLLLDKHRQVGNCDVNRDVMQQLRQLAKFALTRTYPSHHRRQPWAVTMTP